LLAKSTYILILISLLAAFALILELKFEISSFCFGGVAFNG